MTPPLPLTHLPALPPYAQWLGVHAEHDAEGMLRFVLPFGDRVLGRPGFVHGGAIAGLLEIAAVGTLFAAVSAEEPRPRIKPVTVTADFMRGARMRDTIAAARITRLGARIANVEAFAWQESVDRLVAGSRMTLTVYRD